jgi:hypothetical protein
MVPLHFSCRLHLEDTHLATYMKSDGQKMEQFGLKLALKIHLSYHLSSNPSCNPGGTAKKRCSRCTQVPERPGPLANREIMYPRHHCYPEAKSSMPSHTRSRM